MTTLPAPPSDTATVSMETPDFKQDALAFREQAQSVVITDQASYDLAAEGFAATCALEKIIVEHYKPMKASAFETHKRIVAAEKSVLDPVLEAKNTFSRAIGAFEAAKRAEEETERRRLEIEAEQSLQNETLDEAAFLESLGASPEEVDAVLEAPRAVPKVQVQPTFTRSGLVSGKTYYSAELKTPNGLEELVKAAAANFAAYGGYLLANLPAACAVARAQKEVFQLPGFKLKKDTKAAGRGR